MNGFVMFNLSIKYQLIEYYKQEINFNEMAD